MAARKRAAPKPGKAPKAVRAIEQGAKRAEQKAQGALDGRFRERKVESKKRYSRKARPAKDEE